MADLTGRKKNQRVGDKINLALADATPEMGDNNTQGLLRNFVRFRGTPKWGSAILKPYDTVANHKANVNKFQPNEAGIQTVVLVYFDKGGDGNWRFVQVVTEEVHVNA